MTTFLSTFITGLQEPVADLLKLNLKNITIKLILDGAVLYETDEGVESIQKLKFLNNTFLVLEKFDQLPEKEPFEHMLKDSLNLNLDFLLDNYLSGEKTFRVIISNENDFVTVSNKLLFQIEKKISTLDGARLRKSSHNPQVEFWFLRRSENVGFFLFRLTKNITNKKLSPGMLRPELAHILCFLSEPNENDVFLDPFAGSGSIPIERVKSFPFNLVFAGDNNKNLKEIIKEKKKTKEIIVKVQDALDMKAFENNFITKIVTDPPWGLFENIKDITFFYASMMNELLRVLKPGGTIVLLTARKAEFEEILKSMKDVVIIQEKYDILVSGKKSSIYKLFKS